jgi:hypothetical protein
MQTAFTLMLMSAASKEGLCLLVQEGAGMPW